MADNDKKYFCDGMSLYEVSSSSMRMARNTIDTISTNYAYYENKRLKYRSGKTIRDTFGFCL